MVSGGVQSLGSDQSANRGQLQTLERAEDQLSNRGYCDKSSKQPIPVAPGIAALLAPEINESVISKSQRMEPDMPSTNTTQEPRSEDLTQDQLPQLLELEENVEGMNGHLSRSLPPPAGRERDEQRSTASRGQSLPSHELALEGRVGQQESLNQDQKRRPVTESVEPADNLENQGSHQIPHQCVRSICTLSAALPGSKAESHDLRALWDEVTKLKEQVDNEESLKLRNDRLTAQVETLEQRLTDFEKQLEEKERIKTEHEHQILELRQSLAKAEAQNAKMSPPRETSGPPSVGTGLNVSLTLKL